MSNFKEWLKTRNNTKSAKGEMVAALRGYQYPSFVLMMWMGEYELPEDLRTREHRAALTRLKWETERDGFSPEDELKRLNIDSDENPKWWAKAVDGDAEWEDAAPDMSVTPVGASAPDRKPAAGKKRRAVSDSRYLAAILFFIGD